MIADHVIICSGNALGEIQIWDVENFRLVAVANQSELAIKFLHCHNFILVSGSIDGTLCIF